MKERKLIRSLRDLAAIEAKNDCAEDKPYFHLFVEAYEKKILDDILQAAIDKENVSRVLPVMFLFVQKYRKIPIPFEIDKEPVNQIRMSHEPSEHFEVSCDCEYWFGMDNSDIIRLYVALDDAGYLDNLD